MRLSYSVAAAMICIVSGTFVHAQTQFSVERPRLLGGNLNSVIEGQPAQPKNWPATFIFNSGGAACTSTLIGERVLLTAGHCVGDGAKGEFTLQAGQKTVVTCNHHPGYSATQQPPETKNLTKDFSLCATDAPLAGIPFERVSTSLVDVRKDMPVRLLGFGCTERMGADQSFGVLFTGMTTVIRPPTNGEDIHVITRRDATLCSGDSGGGAYADPDVNGRRALIGVNSRSNLVDQSKISSTATAAFLDWAFDWSKEKNVQICGLHAAAKGCR